MLRGHTSQVKHILDLGVAVKKLQEATLGVTHDLIHVLEHHHELAFGLDLAIVLEAFTQGADVGREEDDVTTVDHHLTYLLEQA
jgi:hypothetical protein